MPKGMGYGNNPHEGNSGGYKDYMRDEKSAGGGKMGKATKTYKKKGNPHNSAGRNENAGNRNGKHNSYV